MRIIGTSSPKSSMLPEVRLNRILIFLNLSRFYLIFSCVLFVEEVRKERKKSTKHDSLVRVASMLNEAGRQGVEAAWEQSEEFHEKWKLKARDFFARTEWKKRKTIKRVG